MPARVLSHRVMSTAQQPLRSPDRVDLIARGMGACSWGFQHGNACSIERWVLGVAFDGVIQSRSRED